MKSADNINIWNLFVIKCTCFFNFMAKKGKHMHYKWIKRKINNELSTFYTISKFSSEYSISLFEYNKNDKSRIKIVRQVTPSKEKSKKILSSLIKNKVTICTLIDVISDLLICWFCEEPLNNAVFLIYLLAILIKI